MTRLARYLAGWLMSKHALALDAALVAEERDRWEAEATRAREAAPMLHHAEALADALESLVYHEVAPVDVTKAKEAWQAYVEWADR